MSKKMLIIGFCLLLVSNALGSGLQEQKDERNANTITQAIKISEEQWIEVKLQTFDKPNAESEPCYQPIIVVITQPEHGSVFHTRDVVVEGYACASPGCKLIYWEWTWEWATGSYGNSSYISPPADYVEFRITIHGLWLGANKITVRFYDACKMMGYDQITIYYEDIYPPTVVITYPPDGSIFYDPYITVQGYADDDYSIGIAELAWIHIWEEGSEEGSKTFDPPVLYVKFSIPIMLREGGNIIEVVATDLAGNEGSDFVMVYYVLPLAADADGPYFGSVGEEIQFSGSATGGVPPYTWYWDFGDGATSNEQNPKHAYKKAGRYVAKLTVTDSEGKQAQDSAQVTVYEKLVADADGPYGAKVGQNIFFHGSAKGGVPPYRWLWNFGDGTFSNQQNPVHAYSAEGAYLVSLTVTDSIGNTDTDSTWAYVYTVDNTPPFVKITKPVNALYVKDKKILPLIGTAVIIGNITIMANASDNVGIAKVDFYIDGRLMHTNYSTPYYWLWDEFVIGRHIIKVVAYDFEGNSAFDEQKVWIINLKRS